MLAETAGRPQILGGQMALDAVIQAMCDAAPPGPLPDPSSEGMRAASTKAVLVEDRGRSYTVLVAELGRAPAEPRA